MKCTLWFYQVRSQEMIVRWFGVSALTVSICTASWSGWTLSKCSSSAQCVVRNGSLKSELACQTTAQHLDFHCELCIYVIYFWITVVVMNVLFFFIQGRHFMRRLNNCTLGSILLFVYCTMVYFTSYKCRIWGLNNPQYIYILKQMVWFCPDYYIILRCINHMIYE